MTALMISLVFAFSCSSSDDEDGDGGGTTLLNTPVAGKIYGHDFTISSAGGYASNITESGVQKVNIYLTAQNVGCDAPDGTEFPVSILTPRAVGTYTTNVAAFFKDPNSDDFVNVSSLTVEIISVDADEVVGRVMASSVSTENNINGKFTVPYCD